MLDCGLLFLFILATIGLTHIIVDSSILEGFRTFYKRIMPEKLGKLVDCHQCSGFWAGIICALIIFGWNPLIIVACGFAGSGLGLWSDTKLKEIESKIPSSEENKD